MHLLTWQGSVVCVPDADGDLTQAPLAADSGQTPMDFDAAALDPRGGSLRHPDLGSVRLEPAERPGGLYLQRDGLYLCATPYSIVLAFDREEASLWETFLPVSAADLADLQHILAYPWIERDTRRVLPRRLVRVEEFALRLGAVSLGLAGELPAHIAARNSSGKPVALRAAGDDGATREFVIAEPRSSALLNTALWPVRARRSSEVLALAVHRQILGEEPEQEVFEQTTQALLAKGGAPGLSDVLEEMLSGRTESAPAAFGGPSQAGGPAPGDVLNAWAQREVAPWLLKPVSRSRAELLWDEFNETETGFVFSIANRQATLREKPAKTVTSDFAPDRARIYLEFFSQVAATLPEDFTTTFCAGLDDTLGARYDAPVFCFQKVQHANSILLPDVDFLPDFLLGRQEVQDRLTYDVKTPTAVFAGSTTGGAITLNVAQNYAIPRLRAARYFQDSTAVDFRLPRISQCESQDAEDFLSGQPFCRKGALSWQDQFRHRFILSMDGNGATCSRVAIALRSNSVLMKYNSDNVLFYFHGLQPWLHYVPVNSDRDVERVLALAQHAPELFRNIAENGKRFAQTYLTGEALIAYTARVLQFYEASFADSAMTLGALAPQRSRSMEDAAGTTIIAHQQNIGDIGAGLDEWVGTPGSGNALEGFALLPGEALASEGLWLAAVLQGGGLAAFVPAGEYCGTRGENTPIHGFCIRTSGAFASAYEVLYEAVFTDGSELGPMVAGIVCKALSGAPLEAMRVTIVARADARA
jgi:hypothetical protein